MGVVLRVRKQKAFLRDGEWRSADLELEAQLNRLTTEWILSTGGPALGAPDPELVLARHIAKTARGRILLHVPCKPKDGARTYFALRQFSLPFA